MRAVLALTLVALGGVLGGCFSSSEPAEAEGLDVHQAWVDPEQFLPEPVTHAGEERSEDATRNPGAGTIAIVGATVLTAEGAEIVGGTVIAVNGSIRYVGTDPEVPEDATVIDGKDQFLTPGLIDTHSHIGVYASPRVDAHSDGNEMSAPVTAHAKAAYGYWPQDPAITRARAGGVTTALILPGSANLVGGNGATVVMKPGRTTADVLFPGAPPTIKMACGENPKRVYADKGGPGTRMALYAAFRSAFHAAAEYMVKKQSYHQKRREWLAKRRSAIERHRDGEKVKSEAAPDPLAVDLGLEALGSVLSGETLVQIHCYRADEMRRMIAIADEFGFSIRSFHHALEAYKIRDVLIAHNIAVSTWADWWGFKMEALDGIPEGAALYSAAGGRAVIHSDSAVGIQFLNQEASKAMHAGRRAGLDISVNDALRWITANPAWVLGIDDVVGTIEVGKRADLVLWSGHPMSVYSRPTAVVQFGELAYELDRGLSPTDFELGYSAVDSVEPADGESKSEPASAGAAGGSR